MKTNASLRTRGGVLFKLIILLAILAAMTVLAWMLFLPWGVSRTIAKRSGYPTEAARLAVNPVTGMFSGGGLHIDNPVTQGGGVFVRVANFTGKAEPGSATRAKFVIEELTIDLTQLVVVVGR
ncbi:MAG: hypothetical protein J6386_09215 [Candidatus Synoicihabitans palmerolidicus]|nr:hypothetical protein [Candidatus Synoicihabitans palmerolidicus]